MIIEMQIGSLPRPRHHRYHLRIGRHPQIPPHLLDLTADLHRFQIIPHPPPSHLPVLAHLGLLSLCGEFGASSA